MFMHHQPDYFKDVYMLEITRVEKMNDKFQYVVILTTCNVTYSLHLQYEMVKTLISCMRPVAGNCAEVHLHKIGRLRVIISICNKLKDPFPTSASASSKNSDKTAQTKCTFLEAQGQLTPQSMVGSGQISNLSETLWLTSSPANMKKIRSKLKELEC